MVAAAGFSQVPVATIAEMGEATSAADLATGLVRGNPLWDQLVERGIDAEAFQGRVEAAIRRDFGDAPCRTPMSAHVVTAVA